MKTTYTLKMFRKVDKKPYCTERLIVFGGPFRGHPTEIAQALAGRKVVNTIITTKHAAHWLRTARKQAEVTYTLDRVTLTRKRQYL